MEKAISSSQLENKIDLLLQQQVELFERINKLEGNKPTPLFALPQAQEEPPELNHRELIVQRINAYARQTGKGYSVIWNELYYQFYHRHHINLKIRAEKLGIKRIDVIAEMDMLKEAWVLSCKIFPLSTDI